MPVIVKPNTVDHLCYDYQVQRAGWSLLDTVTSTIHQRLHIFRTHHHKCAARRQNALSYELRQESQRTEWLKRKYVDSVRQQQGISGPAVTTTRMDSVTTGSRANRDLEVTESNLKCGPVDLLDLKPNHANQVQASSPLHTNNGVIIDDPPPAKALEMDSIMKIKREPGVETSSPCRDIPSFAMKNDSRRNSTNELKQRMTLPLKPDWNDTEDGKDELKLTAYDVIAGVISTPPIKPLESDTDSTYAGRSSTKGIVNKAPPPTTPNTPISTPISKINKDHHSLDQDLDEFSKVMHQVTQEQIAKERKQSLVSELETAYPGHSHNSRLLSPSPYISLGHLTTAQNNFYHHHHHHHHHHPGYQAPRSSQSQVDHAFKAPGNDMETKLMSCLLNDSSSVVSSSNNQVPPTPTTPLEHYPSPPPPPPQMPHPSNQSSSCLAPYSSSTPMGYSYGNNTSVSVKERWPLPSLQPELTSSQGTIMACASSRVVARAGQKRPMPDMTVPPPTKIKGSILGNMGSSLHQEYPSAMDQPYQGTQGPLTFPHKPL